MSGQRGAAAAIGDAVRRSATRSRPRPAVDPVNAAQVSSGATATSAAELVLLLVVWRLVILSGLTAAYPCGY